MPDLRGRPRADSGQRQQQAIDRGRIRRVRRGGALELVGIRRADPRRLRPPPVDSGLVPVPRRQVPASARPSGNTRMPAGAGPGAGSPCRVTSRRQAAAASRPITFCSSTAGISASSTRPVRGTRSPTSRRMRVAQQRVPGVERLGVVAAAEQRRQPGDELGRARPPGVSGDLVGMGLGDPVGDRSGRPSGWSATARRRRRPGGTGRRRRAEGRTGCAGRRPGRPAATRCARRRRRGLAVVTAPPSSRARTGWPAMFERCSDETPTRRRR